MLGPFLAMGLGFAVGIEHAFESDHVAAVSTQISKIKSQKTKAREVLKNILTKTTILGALWGAGHTTTLVLVGFLAYVLAISIHPQIFATLEFGVGMMLVFLGIASILNRKRMFFKTKHRHPHQHKDGTVHFEEHDHDDPDHSHGHKSYFIGLIHGLAGSGSLVVLTAATLENPFLMLGFILVFGIGSIIGMSVVSGIMGLPIVFISRVNTIHKIFRYLAGSFSFVIGAYIIYEIGVLDNLFSIF